MEQLKNSTNFINCGSTVPGNVADILLIFPEKACRGNTRHTKRGPDTQFLCVVLPTPYRTHHIMPPKKKKRGGGFTTTTAAAASAATASAAATSAAAAPSAEPYFGSSGAATITRANNLPRLPVFQLNQGLAAAMGRKLTAPAGEAEAGKDASDVTIPRNQSTLRTAAAASVPTAPADDGESLGSVFDLPDDNSFSGGGDMGGDEKEGVEEDAGVEGAELAALTSVFDCDHIKQKKMNDKDGWECGWCGKFFTPLHATRALKHVLKIKKGGIIDCKALIPPRYLAQYTALSGYHSNAVCPRRCSKGCPIEDEWGPSICH